MSLPKFYWTVSNFVLDFIVAMYYNASGDQRLQLNGLRLEWVHPASD